MLSSATLDCSNKWSVVTTCLLSILEYLSSGSEHQHMLTFQQTLNLTLSRAYSYSLWSPAWFRASCSSKMMNVCHRSLLDDWNDLMKLLFGQSEDKGCQPAWLLVVTEEVKLRKNLLWNTKLVSGPGLALLPHLELPPGQAPHISRLLLIIIDRFFHI